MKRKFISVSGMKRIFYKDRYGERHCIKMWECFEAWLVTKEANESRCINFKQLLSKLISRNGFNPS